MKKLALLAAVLAVGSAGTGAQPGSGSAVRFEAVDVFVDSGSIPLAAYQLEVLAALDPGEAGQVVRLVGVEGGDRGPFGEPPTYDPEALRGERIILAAYSLAEDAALPRGKTRVARIQVEVPKASDPKYSCILTVAGNSAAEEIPARAEASAIRAGLAPAAPPPAPAAPSGK